METLTVEIAREFRDKAKRLPPNGQQDIGERRKLRKELQTRCGLTELVALNIINGFHAKDYVVAESTKEQERIRKEQGKHERIEN